MGFSNERTLIETRDATAANGVCTISVGPSFPQERWNVTRISVTTTSSTETVCRLYRSFVGDSQFLEGTYSGNQDVSDTDIIIRSGETLVAQWTGTNPAVATPNAAPRCDLRVEGTSRIGA